MILGGGDTTCEELFYWGGGAAAVRRGYNAFLWEGPGQVGAYALDPELTYRPDWEVPTRYAVDYVLSRGDVDAERLALTGHSMGGYFAPRAAAYEKRITAVIANSLLRNSSPSSWPCMADPDEPYGEDLEDKADLSDPMKKWLRRGSRIDVGWPVSRWPPSVTTSAPTVWPDSRTTSPVLS
jgi:pimeloyl-ACP methyl ester carboxylesterase